MDGKIYAHKMLETLFDPARPFIYIFGAPTLILIALGRPKLAILWICVAAIGMFFFDTHL
ncbi:MAG: hypothetical protein AAF415_18765 [Pseudomonadota bacterium]